MAYSCFCPGLFPCFFLCSFTFLPHMVFSHQLRGAFAVPLSYVFQTPAVSMLDVVARMLSEFPRVIYPACILFFPVCLKGRQSSWAVCSVNFLVTCVRHVYRLSIIPRHCKRSVRSRRHSHWRSHVRRKSLDPYSTCISLFRIRWGSLIFMYRKPIVSKRETI